MRHPLILPLVILCSAALAPAPARAQVSIGIRLPGLSIGINQPTFPELVPVPGYPVYYAPDSPSNYFFYDGRYWVLQEDDWFCSSWYNGPWDRVRPEAVPVFLLRVPVRFYPRPPAYFRGGRGEDPPRWGEHWGPGWEGRRRGWDRWDRGAAPRPAPLPTYQREYAGPRYPRPEQQQELHQRNYDYQPREPLGRERGPKEFQRPEQGNRGEHRGNGKKRRPEDWQP